MPWGHGAGGPRRGWEKLCQYDNVSHKRETPKTAAISAMEGLTRLVPDGRPAIDRARIRSELGWKPLHTPREGIRQTVEWYLGNRAWWEPLLSKPLEVEA